MYVLNFFRSKTYRGRDSDIFRMLQRYFDSKNEVTKHKVCRVYRILYTLLSIRIRGFGLEFIIQIKFYLLRI